MNQPMPQRKPASTCLLYLPPSLSRATVPNQPNIMKNRMHTPAISTNLPQVASFIQSAAPDAMLNSANEPKIGQCDGSGTK